MNYENKLILSAKNAIRREIDEHKYWTVGYSGGKDSTSLLILILDCISESRSESKIDVVFSNSGIENPVIAKLAINTMNNLRGEFSDFSNISFNVVEPDILKSFWVKVIGRGYPTPTNKFRWCTDVLRINPIMACSSLYRAC